MNLLLRYIDPITLRRLRRFRRIRRAWWSLCILTAAYVVSLFSELIANDSPLYIRFEGRSYFPVLRFYPDNTFTASGRNTRPDYKAIRASERFRRNPANSMVFAPSPFGPLEILDPASIDVPDEVVVSISRQPRLGNVDLDKDMKIVRSQSAGSFFGAADDELRGRKFTDAFSLDPGFEEAVRTRFANTESKRFETELKRAETETSATARVNVSLSTFAPRVAQPSTVRLALREPGDVKNPTQEIALSDDLRILRGESSIWNGARDEEKQSVLALVKRRFSVPVERRTLVLGGEPCEIAFSKTDVRWPFHPTRAHPFGIDEAGRDVFARILYGFRTSMSFGLVLVVSAMVLGVIIGAVQGYFGGLIDITGQRLIEIWSALPFLYIIILMGSVFGRSFLLLIVCYGIFHWIALSYYMRAEFLRLRKQQFVEAARCLGVPTWKIIFKHIFPNALVPIVTFFPFSLVGAVGSLAALDYLGFGMPPPTPSWGELLNQAQELRWAWWLILYPFVSLFLVMLLCVFVGEGVRNAFDPRDYSGIE